MSRPESPDDLSLFRAAVGEVRPVRQDKQLPQSPLPPPHPLHSLADERQALQDTLADPQEVTDVQPGDEVAFMRPGLQRSLFRKLKRGYFPVNAELDLHGMTSQQAKQALIIFLAQARELRLRCVRIIHGKGRRSSNQGPVLKQRVVHWLTQRDDILAFCSTPPSDGGTGAVYVLLRISR